MRSLSILIFLVACGGGSGDDCRSSDECNGELFCSGPNDGPVCGIAPREECLSNAGCFDGNVCHAIGDSCSDDGIGSMCGPPCIDDQSCGPSFVCDGGNCVAQSCEDGFACAGREVCDPGRIPVTAGVFDQHHGCFAFACEFDDECGERFCVNGTCQDAAGRCAEPLLVP